MSSSQMGIKVDRREEGQNKIQLGEKEICILREKKWRRGELVLMLNELTDSVLFFQLVRLF